MTIKPIKLNLTSQNGFTLVEALTAVILLAVLMGVCLNMLIAGSNSWQVNSTKTEILQRLAVARDWMSSDLEQSGSDVITNVPANGTWYSTITFKKSNGVSGGSITWGPTIQYSLSENNLIRSLNGTNQILSKNIQSLQIRRQSATPKLVEVSVQGQKMAPSRHVIAAVLDFTIKLRN